MRPRLPEGQSALTAKDVATSNNTLNTLMGGRKSWMTGNIGNVEPTPRPQVQKPSMSTVLPSPAPSDEPSPLTHKSPPIEPNHATNLQPGTVMPGGPRQQPASLSANTEMQPRSEALSPPAPTNAASRSSPPSKRQKTMFSMSGLPSLKVHTPLIDKHIQESGGLEALSFGIEKPRFSFLRTACSNEDWFYVVLHQIFCNWTLGCQNISSIKAFDDIQTISAGFQIISQLILSNDNLSSIHLHWFAAFPSPLPDLIARSEPYMSTIQKVASCLRCLAFRWTTFTAECRQRGYPPLVDELLRILGLFSPILQEVAFTASRRNLGIVDDEFGQQIENIFWEDRKSHWELSLRYNTDAPPTAKEIHECNAKVVDRYRKIVRRRQEILRRHSQTWVSQHTLASNVPSPTHQSPPVQGGPPAALGRHDSQPRNTTHSLATAYDVSNVAQYGGSSEISPVTRPPVVLSSPWHDQSQFSAARSQSTDANRHLSGRDAMPMNSDHLPQVSYTPSDRHAQIPIQPNTSPLAWNPQVQASVIAYQQRQLEELSRLRQIDQQRLNSINQNIAVPIVTPQGYAANAGNIPAASFSPRPGGTNTNSSAVGPQTMPPRQPSIHNQLQNALMPPSDYVPPVQAGISTPELSALHQAHIRSPRLSTINAQRSQQMRSPQRWYQAIKNFAVGPTLLPSTKSLSRFEFKVSESDLAKVAKDQRSGSSLAVRELSQGSIQYRVRCIQAKTGEATVPISDWVVSDCTWPPTIFLEINNHVLEVRRKRQHGKDIPIDITPYIASTSSQDINRIQVSLLRSGNPHKESRFGFAVEVVEVMHHKQVLGLVLQKHIPMEDTIRKIDVSLSSLAGHDDDDITMVTSDLAIDLTDPFMAKIFNIPVRGDSCLHRECFDLETFLTTRTSKPKRPEEPCMVDVWKCPLCGSDARPYSLRVDDFLVRVRQKLAADGNLDCKSITVNATGEWTPKLESVVIKRSASSADFDGKDDDSDYHSGDRSSGFLPKSRAASKEIEVIALDED